MKLIPLCWDGNQAFSFYCPGCKTHHMVPVKGPRAWGWNGSTDSPTFSPSIKVTMGPKPDPITHLAKKGAPNRICHSFIKDGVWEFLSDCWHDLAGQKIPMEDVDYD